MKNTQPHMKHIDVADSKGTTSGNLSISLEKLSFIIIKAREFDVKVPPVEPDPGSNPADGQQREILEDYANDPTQAELKGAMDALNTDEKADLVALMWMGRGDFDAANWEEARTLAFEHQHRVAQYLMGNPQLGDLLEEGLAQLGYSIEEFELDRL